MADKLENGTELVTLGEYPEPMEAEMAMMRLQSAGIETFLSGENAAIMAPGLGPLHLQVRPEDEQDARAILTDVGTMNLETTSIGATNVGAANEEGERPQAIGSYPDRGIDPDIS